MNGKYDSASKDLVDINPADLLALLGQPRPPDRVRTIDSDLSTIATAADKVIWIDDPDPWILHNEFHTYWDGELPLSVNARNALLRKRHGTPVASVIFLLRSSAYATNLSGVLFSVTPIGKPSEFCYEVIRMWTLPPETMLSGPLSMLPYAPLCGIDEAALPEVVARMKERIANEATPLLADRHWAATYILTRPSRNVGLSLRERFVLSRSERPTFKNFSASFVEVEK